LYSQNVNIYLAPTADGRDTWLPLLRTIALEGRTFVLSSNQCIRENDLPSWIKKADTASATNGNHQSHSRNLSNGSSKHPAGQDQASRREMRRNSVVTKTDDNHEITWPSPGSKSPVVSGRRSSITVPEGPHEVCLPALSHQHSAPAGPVSRPTAPEQLSKLAEENGLSTLHSPFVSHGGSCIVGPNGDVLAGPLWDDTDGLLTVQVDLEECIRGRLDFDCAGSYSRNDSFELKVKDLDLDPP
jgi:nitrilase